MHGLLSPAPRASATQYVTAISTRWWGTGWAPSPPPPPRRDRGAAHAAGDGNVPEHRQPRPRRGLDIRVHKVKLSAGLGDPSSLLPPDKAALRIGLFHSHQKEILIFFVHPADTKLPSGRRQPGPWEPAPPLITAAAAEVNSREIRLRPAPKRSQVSVPFANR